MEKNSYLQTGSKLVGISVNHWQGCHSVKTKPLLTLVSVLSTDGSYKVLNYKIKYFLFQIILSGPVSHSVVSSVILPVMYFFR